MATSVEPSSASSRRAGPCYTARAVRLGRRRDQKDRRRRNKPRRRNDTDMSETPPRAPATTNGRRRCAPPWRATRRPYRRCRGDWPIGSGDGRAAPFSRARVGDADIEDVVQETLLAIHLKRGTWDGGPGSRRGSTPSPATRSSTPCGGVACAGRADRGFRGGARRAGSRGPAHPQRHRAGDESSSRRASATSSPRSRSKASRSPPLRRGCR